MGSFTFQIICPSTALCSAQGGINKNSHRKIPWLVGGYERAMRLFVGYVGEETRLFQLNKNATGLGAPWH
jgi:hypothetical protein